MSSEEASPEEKPSLLQQLAARPNSSEALAQKLTDDWAWVQKTTASASLRTQIASSRSTVQDAVSKVQGIKTSAESTVTWMQTPSEATLGAGPPCVPSIARCPGSLRGGTIS